MPLIQHKQSQTQLRDEYTRQEDRPSRLNENHTHNLHESGPSKATTSSKLTVSEYLDGSYKGRHLRSRIRKAVINPDTSVPDNDDAPKIRSKLWKHLLDIERLDVESYREYVSKGPSEVGAKIRDDAFRTMTSDVHFQGKVKEEMLIRLLDAFVWKSQAEEDGQVRFSYVQGMNVLAAPFLYVMPTQIEAFTCFSDFIEYHCPQYVQPTLSGVHRGLALLDKCLETFLPDVYDHLKGKNLSAEIYAFAPVLTFCACIQPLEEVLVLWDFLLASGFHWNIFVIVAQMTLVKDKLLESSSPMTILRKFPPLNARAVIPISISFLEACPRELWKEIEEHTTEPTRYPAPGS